MITAKVLENGTSQAVTLPKECHISEDEVFNSLNMFSDDFMENGREQGTEEERESL